MSEMSSVGGCDTIVLWLSGSGMDRGGLIVGCSVF